MNPLQSVYVTTVHEKSLVAIQVAIEFQMDPCGILVLTAAEMNPETGGWQRLLWNQWKEGAR